MFSYFSHVNVSEGGGEGPWIKGKQNMSVRMERKEAMSGEENNEGVWGRGRAIKSNTVSNGF